MSRNDNGITITIVTTTITNGTFNTTINTIINSDGSYDTSGLGNSRSIYGFRLREGGLWLKIHHALKRAVPVSFSRNNIFIVPVPRFGINVLAEGLDIETTVQESERATKKKHGGRRDRGRER